MQTIKKFVVLTWATWGCESLLLMQIKLTNAIYAEKGQLMIHLGNVPDKYQKIQVPVWSTKMVKMTWFGILWNAVTRIWPTKCHWPTILIKPDFIMSMSMGWRQNEQLTGLYPLNDRVQQKTWLPLQPKITIHTHLLKEFEVDLKVFEDVDEICLPPSGLKKWAGWSGLVSRKERSHLDISNCAFQAQKTREVGYFISTSTRKARDN